MVEFGTFLLYLGPILLKKLLSTEKYEHFLYLHISIQILACPKSTIDQIKYDGECLKHFAFEFG